MDTASVHKGIKYMCEILQLIIEVFFDIRELFGRITI